MKKKLFIRDLQKRKSSSTLLTSVPSKLQPIGTSCFTRPADQQSQPTYSTQAIGEEGSGVKPIPINGDGFATTAAIGEEGSSEKPIPINGDGFATTAAIGEEGSSVKPIDGPVLMYAVPSPDPIVTSIQEEGGIAPIDRDIVKYGPPAPIPIEPRPVDPILVKYGPPTPIPIEPRPVDPILVKYGPPTPIPIEPRPVDPILVKYGPPTPIPIQPRPVDPILVKYGPPTPIPIQPRPVDPILVKYGPPTPVIPVTTQAIGEEGSSSKPISGYARVIAILTRRLELFKQRFGPDSIRVQRTQELIDKFQRRISNTTRAR